MPAEVWAIEKEAIEEKIAWDDRANWRAANLMCLIANCHTDPKSGRTWSPDDFMPRKELSEEELADKLDAVLSNMPYVTKK
jgi:hypothetical protein